MQTKTDTFANSVDQDERRAVSSGSTLVAIFIDFTQQTHNVVNTLLQRGCNITKVQPRCNDVDATLCICWVFTKSLFATTDVSKLVDGRAHIKSQE